MAFTIEFQPQGIRLECSTSINALDAARQAGIGLKAICGGEGSCGKCVIQILSENKDCQISQIEKELISESLINSGYRLACLTILKDNVKIFIPSDSLIEDQILQVEGEEFFHRVCSAVNQQDLRVPPAQLDDLSSDFSRIKLALKNNQLNIDINALRLISQILRKNDWKVNLWIQNNNVTHVTMNQDQHPFGLAVDVGSTKIACYLVDLKDGKTLTAKGAPNPQIVYGEDIMARLGYAMQGVEQSDEFFRLTINVINQTKKELCARIKRSPNEIADICLVGNTAMHHFFLNLPINSLAVSPFVPVTTDTLKPTAHDLKITAIPGTQVYAPPVIAGFIGSDHLAFLLAAGFGIGENIRLGIDIGTNTEIALQVGNEIVSVSTASGPAFEGAHIKYGMRAAPGAIEHVLINPKGIPEIQVIGQQEPVGICGSGILDAVAQMRFRDILNKRGRINKSAPGVKTMGDGKIVFSLSTTGNGITISQKDVDQILLAKGAIRAGIDILMDHLGIAAIDVEEVVIAGAFGSYMLPQHAIGIGMIPDVPLNRIKVIGNAAGAGARMMLTSTQSRIQAEMLAKKIKYLELTIYPDFPMFYAKGIRA